MSEVFEFEIDYSDDLLKVLELQGIPKQFYKDYLSFNTSFVSFLNDILIINVTFAEPLIYQSGIHVQDFIKITFLKPKFFNLRGEIPGRSIVSNSSRVLMTQIPKQFDYSQASNIQNSFSDKIRISL